MKPYARLLVHAVHRLVVHAAQSRDKQVWVEQIVAAAQANQKRPPRRRPPEAGILVPAIPPRGPLPLQGGAEAPLDYEADGPAL